MKKIILALFILCSKPAFAEDVATYKISGIDRWFNSKPLEIANLKNQIVLVDFWAYSCVVCLHSVPSLIDLNQKYQDKGLVIIGVHTPEFGFEKNLTNVEKAIKKYNINYPVALDNKRQTWNNFKNHYWPAQYLFDKNGKLIYYHFGENEEDVLENKIREALGLNKENLVKKIIQQIALDKQTPEIYLGSDRSNNDANKNYDKLEEGHFALQGDWKIEKEFIESRSKNSSIKLNFSAKKVFMVLGKSGTKPVKVKVLLNGKEIDPANYGSDMVNGEITVKDYRLYNLLNLQNKTSGILEVIISDRSLRAYAFTFRAQ